MLQGAPRANAGLRGIFPNRETQPPYSTRARTLHQQSLRRPQRTNNPGTSPPCPLPRPGRAPPAPKGGAASKIITVISVLKFGSSVEGTTSPAAEGSGPLHPLKGTKVSTQNKVSSAALPPPQASCLLPRNHPQGWAPCLRQPLQPRSQGSLKSKRVSSQAHSHSAPGMPRAVTRMALITGFQSPGSPLGALLPLPLKEIPNVQRVAWGFGDALALQLTTCTD